MDKKVTFFFILLFLNVTSWVQAQLKPLSNEELSTIQGQAGISIEFDNAQLYNQFQLIELHDSDDELSANDALSLHDVVIGNGQGWGYTINTSAPFTLDIVKFSQGWWDIDPDYAFQVSAPGWEQNPVISIGSISLCGQDLGSLKIGPIERSSFKFWLAPPDDNTAGDSDCGLYFKYWEQSKINDLTYTYNQNNGFFQAQSIQLAESFSGPPEDPSTWGAQGQFLIGKEGGTDGDFGRINITRTDYGNIFSHDYRVQLDMDFPMQGSLRIENLNNGGTNFGPIAIDGLTVHRLSVTITP